MTSSPSRFSKQVVDWYHLHGRHHLPWQKNSDPYSIWVSEIMLQQTQVSTVIGYYERFMQALPTLKDLAMASEDLVLQLWSGLGYYARARHLQACAKKIMAEKNGIFPDHFDDLLSLPGIGRSTAGAILSFAYQKPYAILDGNVKRVLARHFAISGWPGESVIATKLWQLSEQYTPKKDTHFYNQAMMDLGASICTRSKPQCQKCPVQKSCKAYALNSPQDFPGKKAKKTKPIREIELLLIVDEAQSVLLEKRPSTGIWGGLWSLPERQFTKKPKTNAKGLNRYTHQFTHFQLDIYPTILVKKAKEKMPLLEESRAHHWHKLGEPFPGGIATPIKNILLQYQMLLEENATCPV